MHYRVIRNLQKQLNMSLFFDIQELVYRHAVFLVAVLSLVVYRMFKLQIHQQLVRLYFTMGLKWIQITIFLYLACVKRTIKH